MMTRVLGAYELGAPFGALGCGMAMRAVHVVSRQPRTVIVLSPQLMVDPTVPDALRREAERMSGRHEDGVVELLDVDTDGSIAFAVVEGLSGQTLRDRLRGGGLGPELALTLLEQLATTLDQESAQESGHAAISPRNLVLDGENRLVLVDLGLARVLDQSARQLLFDAGYEAVASIADGRLADLHGFGLLARELLAGAPASTAAVLDRHLADSTRPAYRSAEALAVALREALDGADASAAWLVPPPGSPPPPDSTRQTGYTPQMGVTPPPSGVSQPQTNGQAVPMSTPPRGATPVPAPPTGQPDLAARVAAAAAHIARGEWDQAGRAYAEITRQAGRTGNRQLATYASSAMAAGAVAEAFAALAGGRLDLASQRIAAAQGALSSDRTMAAKVAEAADSVTTIVARVKELTERLRAGSALRGLRLHTQAIDTALDRTVVPRSFHDALDPIMVACDGALATETLTPELARLGERLPGDEQNAWRELVRLLLTALTPAGTTTAAAMTAAITLAPAAAPVVNGAGSPPAGAPAAVTGATTATSAITGRMVPPPTTLSMAPSGAPSGRRLLPKLAVMAGIVAVVAVVVFAGLFLFSPSTLRLGTSPAQTAPTPPAQAAGASTDQSGATPLALGGGNAGGQSAAAVPGQSGAGSAAPPQSAAPAAKPVLVAPPPSAADLAETRADGVLAQAKGMIEAAQPDDDGAVKLLDDLGQQLAPESPKRAEVNNLTGRALLDLAQQQISLAFVWMHENQGSDSKRMLGEARERVDRAAGIKATDASLQQRVTSARDQLDLTGWWVDFDVAYQAKNFDAQIDALKKIVAKNPDYKTAEGTAKEKLYAAYVNKAEAARSAGQDDVAKQALADAGQVDPNNKLTEQLQTAWYPPPTPTPVPAQPTAVPTQVAQPQPAPPVPAAKPVAPAPAAPKPQIVQQPAQPVVQEQPAPPPPQPTPVPQPIQPIAPVVPPPAPKPAAPTPVPVQPTPVPVPPTPVPQPQPKPQQPQQAEQPHTPSIDVTLGGPSVGVANDSNQQSDGGGSQGHGNESGKGGN
jgi:tetratricopeptide (TPR) repeat protein